MNNEISHSSHWLTEKQVAKETNLSLSKLRQDRHKCRGITYSKIGRSVRYAWEDVKSYMSEKRIKPLQ